MHPHELHRWQTDLHDSSADFLTPRINTQPGGCPIADKALISPQVSPSESSPSIIPQCATWSVIRQSCPSGRGAIIFLHASSAHLLMRSSAFLCSWCLAGHTQWPWLRKWANLAPPSAALSKAELAAALSSVPCYWLPDGIAAPAFDTASAFSPVLARTSSHLPFSAHQQAFMTIVSMLFVPLNHPPCFLSASSPFCEVRFSLSLHCPMACFPSWHARHVISRVWSGPWVNIAMSAILLNHPTWPCFGHLVKAQSMCMKSCKPCASHKMFTTAGSSPAWLSRSFSGSWELFTSQVGTTEWKKVGRYFSWMHHNRFRSDCICSKPGKFPDKHSQEDVHWAASHYNVKCIGHSG